MTFQKRACYARTNPPLPPVATPHAKGMAYKLRSLRSQDIKRRFLIAIRIRAGEKKIHGGI